MRCQRCKGMNGLPATHYAFSSELLMAVCAVCVLDALALPNKQDDSAVSVRPLGGEIDPVGNGRDRSLHV